MPLFKSGRLMPTEVGINEYKHLLVGYSFGTWPHIPRWMFSLTKFLNATALGDSGLLG